MVDQHLAFLHAKQSLEEYLKWTKSAGPPHDRESLGKQLAVTLPHTHTVTCLLHSLLEKHGYFCEVT